jgi:hypothetical protein
MRKWIAVSALVLAGCAAQQIPYQAHVGISDPKSIIEQALMEQDEDRRPEFVDAQVEYVEFGKGTTSRDKGFGVSRSKHEVTRLYYRSVKQSNLYAKRGRYIVQFRNAQGALLTSVVLYDGDAARRFIDAVATMQSRQSTQ